MSLPVDQQFALDTIRRLYPDGGTFTAVEVAHAAGVGATGGWEAMLAILADRRLVTVERYGEMSRTFYRLPSSR